MTNSDERGIASMGELLRRIVRELASLTAQAAFTPRGPDPIDVVARRVLDELKAGDTPTRVDMYRLANHVTGGQE